LTLSLQGLSLSLQFLGSVDWPLLRAARLSALLDSPQAFASTYDDESRWGEADWRQVLDGAIWITAQEAENVVGLAKSVAAPDQDSVRYLESIWVAQKHRRHGVFRALLRHLAGLHHGMGVTDLMLWVLADNHTAELAYKSLGFEPTGECQIHSSCGKLERQLRVSMKKILDA
jgi:GNAT superfamily N-acetyltransferase